MKKYIIIYLALFSALSNAVAQSKAASQYGTSLFNSNWQFQKNADTVIRSAFFKSTTPGWQTVTLPHTANIEEVVTPNRQWQGLVYYRKFFKLGKADKGKHIAIRLEAAMNNADVYLNGKYLLNHKGGYLPFDIDITNQALYGFQNCLLIRLNNQDNADIPPGKPLKDLDFNFYSGLYRNAYLIKKQKIYITDAVMANEVNGGGVLLHWDKLSPTSARLNVNVAIRNDLNAARQVELMVSVFDTKGKLITTRSSKKVSVNKKAKLNAQIDIDSPVRWTPESPELYKVIVGIRENGQWIDRLSLKTGVRQIQFKPEGFYLNGKKYMLRGTNRHQEYPYIGYALSDNAQYRDAYKIKDAGFNFVRCSHYPPSPAFLNACDELGILVMDSAPGWQFFGGLAFQKNSLQNITDLVHRDRNHPSVILWESSLNETQMEQGYMEKGHKIVHAELPYTDTYTCGWMDDVFDVFIPARQHAKAPDYWKKYSKSKPILLAEYGDWEYYAQNAGFNQTAYEGLTAEEKTSRQLRGNGQKRMLQQALNFQEAHNDNLNGRITGDANWLMFDYKRGYAPDIEASGIMDMFRLPKFAFYFYQSQRSPAVYKPAIFIANYWNGTPGNTVTVYSNCDEIELLLNGQPAGRQKPDTGRMSNNLAHPPFTFDVAYQPGTITARGYRNGNEVATASRSTPGEPYKIVIKIDHSGKPLSAGKNDAVFVYASVVDKNGTVVPEAVNELKIQLGGNGVVIGRSKVMAEAGTSAFLIKGGDRKGKLNISITGKGLETGNLTVDMK